MVNQERMSSKDRRKRKHGVISNPELQDRIEKRQKLENLTFEQLVDKYIPVDADDKIHNEYLRIENDLVRVYGVQDIKVLMELYWNVIILAAKGKYDLEKLLHDIYADIENRTYIKKDFFEEWRAKTEPKKENKSE